MTKKSQKKLISSIKRLMTESIPTLEQQSEQLLMEMATPTFCEGRAIESLLQAQNEVKAGNMRQYHKAMQKAIQFTALAMHLRNTQIVDDGFATINEPWTMCKAIKITRPVNAELQSESQE